MGRKLTFQEVQNRVHEKSPNVIIIGKYINTRTKTLCKCTQCGKQWEVRIDSLLEGHGCPSCRNKGHRNPISIQVIQQRIHKLSPNIDIIGDYVNTSIKVLCRCNKCNNQWEAFPSNLLNGYGCPECAKNNSKLDKDFVQNSIHKISPNIDIIGHYINVNTKVLCKCNTCNYEWEVLPTSLLNGIGCPNCHNRARYTKESLQNKVCKIFPNIKIIGEYVNINTKITCKCINCGTVWDPTPKSLLAGHGCPKCSIMSKKLSQQVVEERVRKLHPNISILGNYINNNTKILCKCDICGYQWEVIPRTILTEGHGCPNCKQSYGEQTVSNILSELNIPNKIEYPIENPYHNRNFRVDFYIKYNNQIYIIEYNGVQHYIPVEYFGGKIAFNSQVQRDDDLRKYCKENNINLLEIKYNIPNEQFRPLITKFLNIK